MLRKCLWLLFMVGALAVGTARASTLSYTGYSVIDPHDVVLSGDALGHSENAAAGEIQLLGINGGTGTLSTFCIDVAKWLTSAGEFSTGSYLSGSFAELVNALMTNVLPTLGDNRDASAALQVAIWKVEYGDDLRVGANDDVLGLANDYIHDVRTGRWTADRSMRVAVLDGNDKDQSQAYLAPMPEPTSLAMLGVGLLGAVALRRRRRGTREVCARGAAECRLEMRSINCLPTNNLN